MWEKNGLVRLSSFCAEIAQKEHFCFVMSGKKLTFAADLQTVS